jgi:hypothetical protein
MGHEAGKGLGKFNQGIVEPIDESDQKGKHGIGFRKNNNFQRIRESWNFENDPVSFKIFFKFDFIFATFDAFLKISEKEEPDWIERDSPEILPSIETLKSWKKLGKVLFSSNSLFNN